MKKIMIIFTIFFLANMLSANNYGVCISNYNGPSIGFIANIGWLQIGLDGICKTKMEEIKMFNYDYSELVSHEMKQTSIGTRLNVNYIKTKGKLSAQIGPVFGYDRYWFKSYAKIPNASNQIMIIDSTIKYYQWETGINMGLNLGINKRIAIICGTNIGYIYGKTVNFETLLTHKHYKFDFLENKMGIIVFIK